MKKITSYFERPSTSNKRGIDGERREANRCETPLDTAQSNVPDDCAAVGLWPTCWNSNQVKDFRQKNDWICAHNGNLGCVVCRGVGNLGVEKARGLHLSTEWCSRNVSYNGDSREQRLSSLRKKIHEHKGAASHMAALRISKLAKDKVFENACTHQLSLEKEATMKVFRTVYKVAKQNQSFCSYESDIDLQQLNGVDLGRILHSRKSCHNVMDHISSEMRKKVLKAVVESDSKISLMFDESTSLSNKSHLILYLRSCLARDDGSLSPVTLFLNLIELESGTAKVIFDSIMSCLQSYGIFEEYLSEHLISVACDGAAVMLGNKNGVKKLLLDKFPSLLVWHCASHRLELAVGDVTGKLSAINRFKSFMDKLYALYHASPKNSRELEMCAAQLGMQILKIGRILSARWVASSFRTVLAVWQNYPALADHFKTAKQDTRRDGKTRSQYEGLLNKMATTEFVCNLGLMCDSLRELSELSLDLQERDMNIYRADLKMKSVVQVLEKRRYVPGKFYGSALDAKKNLEFKGVSIVQKNSPNDPPIDPNTFYQSLRHSIEERLLSSEDQQLALCTRVLDTSFWPTMPDALYGEREISLMCQKFRICERKMIRAFREYTASKVMPKSLFPLKNALDTVPISSSECERGFSQLNLIVTSDRTSLSTETISSLLFIRIVAPPLRLFDPSKYVDSWLIKGRRSAKDTRSKERKVEEITPSSIWQFL